MFNPQQFTIRELQLFDLLNSIRNKLTNQFKSGPHPSFDIFYSQLLKVQCALFEKYPQSQDLIVQNTRNLIVMMLVKCNSNNNQQANKQYNIKWKKAQLQNDSLKLSNSSELIEDKQKNKYKDQFKKYQYGNNFNNKKQLAEFVPASLLPKGTSVRKKFVPPFKKPQIKEDKGLMFRDSIQEKQQENDKPNPLYKNLQGKLVSIIESEILEQGQKIQWSQIAGLGFAKKIIHEMIVWPMLRPDIFTGIRAPPKGILLFGPPGTGKTMIGRAIASDASATFFSISASSLTSKWVGQSQKLVKTLFSVARLKQPSVIFIDEIDSLLCARSQGEQQSSRKVKTQFLIELDGAKTNNQQRVLIIGATNRPQELDDAVRRRFVRRLYIPLPNLEGRIQLIQTLSMGGGFSLSDQQIQQLAQLTKGFSGADLYSLCSQAALIPLRNIQESIQTIRNSEVPLTGFSDFLEALKVVRPTVNKKLLASFEDWNQSYGSYQFSPDELEKD